MRVKLEKAKAMLHEALATTGADPKDIETMVFMQLEQDLHQNFFSGLGQIDHAVEALQKSIGKKHSIELDMPALKLVNGNGRSARLVGMEVIPMLCDMAKSQGVAIIGIYNAGYHGMLEPYSRAIAEQGLIGIVSASGGPQGVVPFGGRKDILGTNPLSYGIPTNGLPIVFDAATSQYPYFSMHAAKERGQTLPERSYLDADGNWTTDPNKSVAIIAFGFVA
jgi:LDH2 family malate/lactate/ureidoglycolate dehydrogenase